MPFAKGKSRFVGRNNFINGEHFPFISLFVSELGVAPHAGAFVVGRPLAVYPTRPRRSAAPTRSQLLRSGSSGVLPTCQNQGLYFSV